MADESSSYDVNIRTTADESGVAQANAGLDSVDAKAAAINERQVGLNAQKETIAAKQLAALQAEALGQTEVATALEREVALRRLALELQEQSAISEAEALAIAEARSAEEDKVYGKAGKFKLLQNFGIDANTTRTLGIAAFAGFQLQQYITEAAKHYDEMRITGEKESAELEKQVQSWKEMAASAKDLNDIGKLQESITQHAREQIEKLRTLPAEGTKGFFQNAADSTIIWNNALLRAIGVQKQFKTSTDEAADALSGEIVAQGRLGQTLIDSATKNAKAISAIVALPYPEAIRKAREEIQRLSTEQETLNRSDAKQEATWQRKQSQISALSSVISQLVDHQALLQKQEELTSKVGLESDPQKRAALQKELDDLNLQLLLKKQIDQANADAAEHGKKLSADQQKDIENENKALAAKIKLLRELQTLNPQADYGKQADKLLDVKPPTVAQTAKAYYEKVIADVDKTASEWEKARAKFELEQIKLQELKTLDKGSTPPPLSKPGGLDRDLDALQKKSSGQPVSQDLDKLEAKVGDGLSTVATAVGEVADNISGQFDTVVEVFGNLPDALDEGLGKIGGAVQGLSAAITRKTDNLQKQIDAIRDNL
jgi:hypothetical protein